MSRNITKQKKRNENSEKAVRFQNFQCKLKKNIQCEPKVVKQSN